MIIQVSRFSIVILAMLTCLSCTKEQAKDATTNLHIETPLGFVNVAALSPPLARQLFPTIQDPSDVVGFYVLPDVAASLLKDGFAESPPTRYQATRSLYKDEAALELSWNTLTKNFRKENLENPGAKRVLEKFEQIVSKSSSGSNAIDIAGTTSLGIYNDTPILISQTAIIATNVTSNGVSWTDISVFCGGYIKINRSLFTVSVIMPFNGQTSIDEVRSRFTQWMKQCNALSN